MKTAILTYLLLFSMEIVSQEKMEIETLFSSTGDTALIFGGGYNDTLYFNLVKRLNDTIDYIDGFKIVTKKIVITKDDYPIAFLKKNNLNTSSKLLNAENSNDIIITQKILRHRKISKAGWTPDWEKQYYIYKVVLSISIKVCDKYVLKNYKTQRQYEGPSKEEDVKFKNSDIVPTLVKMSDKRVYFFYIALMESYYEKDKKAKRTTEKYSIGQLINCH